MRKKIRFLTEEDKYLHEKLASQAFVCPYCEEDACLPSEKMLGVFAPDGLLAADLEMYDRRVFYNGELLRCLAVGGVASKPEYRGMGAVKALFEYIAGLNEYDVCLLYPFSTSFYSHLGFEPVGEKVRFSAPFRFMKKTESSLIAYLFENGKDDGEKLLSLYNGFASKHDLCFFRDSLEMYPADPYAETEYTYIMKNGRDEFLSYLTFHPDREKSTLFVKELVYSGREGLDGVMSFLYGFSNNFETVVFDPLPSDVPVSMYFTELNGTVRTVSHAGAVKILDIENVKKAAWKDSENVPDTSEMFLPDTGAAEKLFFRGIKNKEELEFIDGAAKNIPPELFIPRAPFFNDSF